LCKQWGLCKVADATLGRLDLDVSEARYILVVLICASPILLWDGLITQGLIAWIIATALMITVRGLRPGETQFFVSLIRPLAATAVVPALWILMQVLPFRPLAHPVWESAEAALGHQLTGTISVDLGATVIALGQYLSFAAIVFLSAAVAIDRRRAEWLLLALAVACTLIALILLAHILFPSVGWLPPFARDQAIDCAAVGAIVATAAVIRTSERYEPPHSSPRLSIRHPLRSYLASSTALAICATALVADGTRHVLVATGCGFAMLVCAKLMREFRLAAWGITVIAGLVIIAAILLVTIQPLQRGKSLLLAFATSSPASTTGSERILDDVPLVGTGAGTFAALAPIYRDPAAADPVAATTAVAFAIELGPPMFWLIVAATVTCIFVLLRASMRRGRDSFYPAMGGSCLVTLLLLAFSNAGLLGAANNLIAAAVLGLAFGQSKSRIVQH
jgi:hypothetical protein